ncbi:unnamed protein product [Staurois parvus]|uniref:Uncharacterized protein n=1 Tax=Staurois parvus TaxID=386267 RepID=A0ABN9G874_9NEOB|nr:unnamed protein product [Staurois parvus]
MYMHTDTCTHTQTHVQIHTCTYDTCTIVHAYRDTHKHIHMYTNTTLKSCSTSLFTHRVRYCTLGGGREHSTHAFLCFHCAQLLSILTAHSANDRSSLSSKPAQQDSPGGHTRPHNNFHSPLASRRVEMSSPV